MSLGFADETAAVNTFASERAALEEFAIFGDTP